MVVVELNLGCIGVTVGSLITGLCFFPLSIICFIPTIVCSFPTVLWLFCPCNWLCVFCYPCYFFGLTPILIEAIEGFSWLSCFLTPIITLKHLKTTATTFDLQLNWCKIIPFLKIKV